MPRTQTSVGIILVYGEVREIPRLLPQMAQEEAYTLLVSEYQEQPIVYFID